MYELLTGLAPFGLLLILAVLMIVRGARHGAHDHDTGNSHDID